MTVAISLDLETLSTHKNAVVVSIGASTVYLDGTPEETIHIFPDVQRQIDMGRHVSFDTIKFWLQQDMAAIQGTFFLREVADVPLSLTMLRLWMERFGSPPVWTKGPAFDGAIIESLAEDFGLTSPIGYKMHRDVRTIDDAAHFREDDSFYESYRRVVENSREGRTVHDAVDDSLMQGDVVRWWLKQVRGT